MKFIGKKKLKNESGAIDYKGDWRKLQKVSKQRKGLVRRVLYGNILFGKKKIKMNTALKIFSKLVYIAVVENGGF